MTASSMGMPATAVIMPTGMEAPGEIALPMTESLTNIMLPAIADIGIAKR